VDRKTKQAHFIKTNTELSSEGQVKIFRDEIFKHHGLPRKVISDRGPQYVSKFMTDLYSLLGIKGNPSTAFHPQTNGQTERINREVEQYLRIWVNHAQDD
jgi:transposase InsO family protein